MKKYKVWFDDNSDVTIVANNGVDAEILAKADRINGNYQRRRSGQDYGLLSQTVTAITSSGVLEQTTFDTPLLLISRVNDNEISIMRKGKENSRIRITDWVNGVVITCPNGRLVPAEFRGHSAIKTEEK